MNPGPKSVNRQNNFTPTPPDASPAPLRHQVLTPESIAEARKPGLYADGCNLYLRVNNAGAKSWQYRYSLVNRIFTIGLGRYDPASTTEQGTLKWARKQALMLKGQQIAGQNPWEQRQAVRQAAKLAAPARQAWRRAKRDQQRAETAANPGRRNPGRPKAAELSQPLPGSFREYAMGFIGNLIAGWDAKTVRDWRQRLRLHVYPVIGDLPIGSIDFVAVRAVLDRIWNEHPETGDKARRHIKKILAAAIIEKRHPGPNHALWEDYLDHFYPAPGKIAPRESHASMDHVEVPAFMVQLAAIEDISAKGLMFLILTAVRTNAAMGARWSEISADGKSWTVPKARGKGPRDTRKPHRVPLSPPARALLAQLSAARQQSGVFGDYIFPGDRPGEPLSNNAFLALLKRLGLKGDVTSHGFRSSFRNWGAEQSEAEFPRWLLEMSLAHEVKDSTEEAYWHTDVLEKRRRLMDAWGSHCMSATPRGGELVQFKRGA